MLIIGIDPGKENGFACWYTTLQKFTGIKTLKTYEILEYFMGLLDKKEPFKVYIEDPNTFKNHGKDMSHRKQGAGSVKARYSVLIEFMDNYKIPYVKTPIQGGHTIFKKDPIGFRRFTKYEKSTSKHGRDAAMMVFGRK
jgi:hypothetical protein